MLRASSWICIVALCPSSSACKKESTSVRPTGLAERVRARLVADHPDVKLTAGDAGTLHLERGEWQMEVGLDNLEITCRSGEDACASAIAALAANVTQSLAKPIGDRLPSRDAVMITLKTSSWVADNQAMLQEKVPDKYEDNKLVAAPAVGDLQMILAVDHPDGIEMMNAGRLRAMKIEPAAAWDLARKNLRTARPALKMSPIEGTPIFTNDEDDDYVSALLAVPELWKPLAGKVKGDLLVAFPARNRVFATGSARPEQVKMLSLVTRKALETEHHALTGTIFRWSETGWSPYIP